ncbi:MAG: LysM domain-containing protein [Anaerolineaceae bacterium]|nr:LysM domain-containing protein [Anaerolineaceae bacterium]MCY4023209.1 LysM domain-containing protein [Anaerolineaceae bacterium]
MRPLTTLLLLCCLLQATPLFAQEQLLQNPGMQGNYISIREGEKPIRVPGGWNVWLHPHSGNADDYFNRADKVDIQPHPGPGPNPQEGSRALAVDCGYVTCTVAVYQQVSVAPNSNVTASAWSHVRACNHGGRGNCGSAIESGSQTRIGVDPNGGNNPNDADIVWSNWSQPHDKWLEVSVNATVTGPTATLFLYSTQASVAELNKTYWDNISLVGGGPGGAVAGVEAAAPAPTVPPQVPFVAPQGAEDDGSIVHVVRPGNTIDSIAVAYDMTRPELLALNPEITNPRIISVGQRILVRRAGGSSAPDESPAAVEEAPAETAPEPAPERVADSGDRPGSRRAVTADAAADLAPAPVSVAALPAMDPLAMRASVCVTLFDDVNRNRLREPDETALASGLLQLIGAGDPARMATGEEVSCFEDLEGGAWLLEVIAPEGYGLTAPGQLQLDLPTGARLDVAVGAAAGLQPPVAPAPDEVHVFSDDIVQDSTAGPLDILFANLGYVAFGMAGLVLIAGGALTLSLRRR